MDGPSLPDATPRRAFLFRPIRCPRCSRNVREILFELPRDWLTRTNALEDRTCAQGHGIIGCCQSGHWSETIVLGKAA